MPPLSPSTTGVPAARVLYDATTAMTTTPAAANATSGRHAVRARHSSGSASSATLSPNWGRVATAAAARTPGTGRGHDRRRAGALARPEQQPQRARDQRQRRDLGAEVAAVEDQQRVQRAHRRCDRRRPYVDQAAGESPHEERGDAGQGPPQPASGQQATVTGAEQLQRRGQQQVRPRREEHVVAVGFPLGRPNGAIDVALHVGLHVVLRRMHLQHPPQAHGGADRDGTPRQPVPTDRRRLRRSQQPPAHGAR